MRGIGRTIATETTSTDAFTYDVEGHVTSESEAVPGLTPTVTLSDRRNKGDSHQIQVTWEA